VFFSIFSPLPAFARVRLDTASEWISEASEEGQHTQRTQHKSEAKRPYGVFPMLCAGGGEKRRASSAGRHTKHACSVPRASVRISGWTRVDRVPRPCRYCTSAIPPGRRNRQPRDFPDARRQTSPRPPEAAMRAAGGWRGAGLGWARRAARLGYPVVSLRRRQRNGYEATDSASLAALYLACVAGMLLLLLPPPFSLRTATHTCRAPFPRRFFAAAVREVHTAFEEGLRLAVGYAVHCPEARAFANCRREGHDISPWCSCVGKSVGWRIAVCAEDGRTDSIELRRIGDALFLAPQAIT